MKIIFAGYGAISPLGASIEDHDIERLDPPNPSLVEINKDTQLPAFKLTFAGEERIATLRKAHRFARLDRATLLSFIASIDAHKSALWEGDTRVGVIAGSARGNTSNWEAEFSKFLQEGEVSTLASPITTAGNMAATIADALGLDGVDISTSMTCASSFQALSVGVALLRSGMEQKILVSGGEAPLTPFTLSQMYKLGIYGEECPHPSRPKLHDNEDDHKNALVLGEGGAAVALAIGDVSQKKPFLEGIGWGRDKHVSMTGVDKEGCGIVAAMEEALASVKYKEEIDAIFPHAPGTILGDSAERAAISKVFGRNVPRLRTTKDRSGHLFGASGILSLVCALEMIEKGSAQKILVNSLGFGSSVVSVVVSGER